MGLAQGPARTGCAPSRRSPDLRGAGWTDAPSHGYTEEQLVADVVALLDALELDRVCLAGLDIGGILGFRICLAHPERVSRFVGLREPHPYPVFCAPTVMLWMVGRFARTPAPRRATGCWPR